MTKRMTRGLAIFTLAASLFACGGAAKQGDTGTKTGASGGSGAESQPSK